MKETKLVKTLPASNFIEVIGTNEVPEGQCLGLMVKGHFLGIHNVDGQFYVVDNTCPHGGGVLHAGGLENDVVVCPIHQWKFDVKTGQCIWPKKCQIATYPVKVFEDQIYVDITSPSIPTKTNQVHVYHVKRPNRVQIAKAQ